MQAHGRDADRGGGRMTRAGSGAGARAESTTGADPETGADASAEAAGGGGRAGPESGGGDTAGPTGRRRSEPWPTRHTRPPENSRAGHRAAAAAALRERLDPDNLRAFANSSPGLLIAVGLLLIVLCASAAVVASDTVGDRQRALDVLLAETEPDAHSAHRLYTAMSI